MAADVLAARVLGFRRQSDPRPLHRAAGERAARAAGAAAGAARAARLVARATADDRYVPRLVRAPRHRLAAAGAAHGVPAVRRARDQRAERAAPGLPRTKLQARRRVHAGLG